jgi:hypothetical protein
VMRIETQRLKNKIFKTQRLEVYLTQKLKTKNYKLKKEIEKSKNQKVSKPPHWPNHQKWPRRGLSTLSILRLFKGILEGH